MKHKKLSYLLLILFTIFLGSYNFIISLSIHNMIDSAIENRLNILFFYFGIVFISGIMFGIANYFQSFLVTKIENNKISVSRDIFLKKFFSKNLKNLENSDKSAILVNVTEDISTVEKLFSSIILPSIKIFITLMLGATYMLFFSFEMFLISLIFVLVIIFLNKYISNKISIFYEKTLNSTEENTSIWLQIFDSKTTINVFSARKFIYKKIDGVFGKFLPQHLGMKKYNTFSYIVNDSGIFFIEIILFFIGIPLVISNRISLGAFIGIWNVAIGSFLWPMLDLPEIFNQIKMRKVSKKRLETSLIDDDIGDYSSDNNFHFDNKGITIISGESGAGKTTFIKKISGLYSTNEEKIVFADQHNNILPVSLKENIAFENELDDRAQKIINYLGLKNLYDLDDLSNLSSGEKARVSIARAISQEDCNVIFLDEPFANLDEHNILLVKNLIEETSRKKAIILISHIDVDFKDSKNMTIIKEENNAYKNN